MRWLAGVLGALVLLTAPGRVQQFPPELPPIPSPELIFASLAMMPLDVPHGVPDGTPVEIDVLVVRAVGVADLGAQGIARINQTIRNSGQGHITVRQVGLTYQTTYTSSGSAATDFNRLYNPNDGFMDEVHALRDLYGADTVVLIGKSGDSCGLGVLLAGQASAFAYVMDVCLSNSSFEHEWGHNIGMAHDAPNASSIPFGYGAGHCYGCGHKDVLTYPSPCGGSRIAQYSNPDLFCPFHPGVPSGTATANNTRVLRERAVAVSNFRPRAVGLTTSTNHPR